MNPKKPVIHNKVGRVSTESVHKCTGRHWDEWIKLIEKAGGKNLNHKDIVALLKTKYKLSPWWQQGIATGYEITIGRKIEGYSQSSGYSTVATKTFPLSAAAVWKLLTTPQWLEIWLKPFSAFSFKPKLPYEAMGGIYGEVRTVNKFKNVRMTWTETEWSKSSTVQIIVVPRNKNKCMLIFQHEKLPDGRIKLKMRDYWKDVLSQLVKVI